MSFAADTAVDSVLEQCGDALIDGPPVLDHSTNLPAKVLQRYQALRAKGIAYFHAPVFMSPAAARSWRSSRHTSSPAPGGQSP